MNLSFLVDRTSLGLGALECNDSTNYWVSATNFDLAGTVFRRDQVRSPYVAGAITVGRVPDAIESRFTIDILGSSQTDVRTKLQTLVTAMTQDVFTVTMTIDSAVYEWNCECADYGLDWSTRERLHAFRPSITFMTIRQPIPVLGPI